MIIFLTLFCCGKPLIANTERFYGWWNSFGEIRTYGVIPGDLLANYAAGHWIAPSELSIYSFLKLVKPISQTETTMMRRSLALAAFLVSFQLFGCDSADFRDEAGYRYASFDEAGDELVTGSLRLEYEDTEDAQYPVRITGTWDLRQIKEGEQPGPQVGEGNLQGSVSADGEVWINLNPDWEDNNVTLEGHFENGHMGNVEGRWIYSTFVGGINGGRFEAERR